MSSLKATLVSVVCPLGQRTLGYAPPNDAASDDAAAAGVPDEQREAEHTRRMLPARFQIPLNAVTHSVVMFRPVTVVVAILLAVFGGLVSLFFTSTHIPPPELGCPSEEPRTRPRPPRPLAPAEKKESNVGWLGQLRSARRRAPVALTSPPLSRSTEQTRRLGVGHELENVLESDEEDEDDEMESLSADHGSQTDGPSEVDTLEDAPSLEGKSKGKGGFFSRRKPKRGASDSSSEYPPHPPADADPAVAAKALSSLCQKQRNKGRSSPPLPSISKSASSSTSTLPTPSSSTTSLPPPAPRPRFVRAPHSSPLLSAEPESYVPSPRRSATPPPAIAIPLSAPSERHRFSLKNTFRSRSRSPLSSPPASPTLASSTARRTSLTSLVLEPTTQVEFVEEAGTPGSPDTSGRSGLSLGDIVRR